MSSVKHVGVSRNGEFIITTGGFFGLKRFSGPGVHADSKVVHIGPFFSEFETPPLAVRLGNYLAQVFNYGDVASGRSISC
jgi:hypothetical protein